MKKGLLILLVAALVVAVAATQPAYAGGPWGWNSNEAEISRHQEQARYSQQNPNGYYYPNGYYGYGPYGYGPGPNVDFRTQERWEKDKGERRVEQTPNLPAKAIDALTLLGALLIIF